MPPDQRLRWAAEQPARAKITLDDVAVGAHREIGVRGFLVQPAVPVFAHDITERKQAEEAAKELIQMKAELVANVSHELRTPICSLKGLLELLVKGKVDDPAVQHEFLTRATGEVRRLATLVDDLLDLSRLEAGRLELNLEQTDIGSLITETVQSLETLAAGKHVPLTYTPPVTTLTVTGDRCRLQQVLVNLIGNAIKFSDAHRSIRITADLETESVVVRVIDEGPGIPEDVLPKLFRRFYRPDTPEKRRGQGTGLGLYISKQIVEAHGGEIGVQSELGVGSTFFLVLPIQGHGAAPGTCGQHKTPLQVQGYQDGGSLRHGGDATKQG